MKKIIGVIVVLILFSGCFNQPEISAPIFLSKSKPDSLLEQGIDAEPDNAIFLEWEEPATADAEGIVGYYLFRGVVKDEEYDFQKIAAVERENSAIFKSDEYTDYDVSLDTLYYYYLQSFNDFTTSIETSDTAKYQLAYAVSPVLPTGDIVDSIPEFKFVFPRFGIDGITHFYFRLYRLEDNKYTIKYFSRTKRFVLSQTTFYLNLGGSSEHTVILYDDLWGQENKRYLEKGDYRWKIDAIASRVGGAPEYMGSESDWMEFTIK